jgi:hypothetical protein
MSTPATTLVIALFTIVFPTKRSAAVPAPSDVGLTKIAAFELLPKVALRLTILKYDPILFLILFPFYYNFMRL